MSIISKTKETRMVRIRRALFILFDKPTTRLYFRGRRVLPMPRNCYDTWHIMYIENLETHSWDTTGFSPNTKLEVRDAV